MNTPESTKIIMYFPGINELFAIAPFVNFGISTTDFSASF